MKKDFPLDIDLDMDDEFIDDFGDMETPEERETESRTVKPIHEDWNIVRAFNVINDVAPKSQLNKDLFIRCAEAFSYLSDKLGINPVQCVIIAMLIEEGKPMSFRQMGKMLGITRLSMMTYYDDLEELFSTVVPKSVTVCMTVMLWREVWSVPSVRTVLSRLRCWSVRIHRSSWTK